MMIPGQAGQGGPGAPPAPSYDPRVMAAAAGRLRASQALAQPQASAGDSGDTEALRQQMQAQRAVQQNYQPQASQVSGGGGADYGQQLAQQHAAAMQAFRQRMAFYSRAAQMSPQNAQRAYMLQAMEDGGGDAELAKAAWSLQDDTAARGQMQTQALQGG